MIFPFNLSKNAAQPSQTNLIFRGHRPATPPHSVLSPAAAAKWARVSISPLSLPRLLDGLAHKIDEPLGVLVRIAGADPIDVRPVLDSFGSLGRLLFHAVVRQYVDDGHKVDFFHWCQLARRDGVDVELGNDAACNQTPAMPSLPISPCEKIETQRNKKKASPETVLMYW